VGLKLNGTHQLLAYADDLYLLGENIDTLNKSRETLIDASKEVSLEVNVEKTKYMLKNGVFWVVMLYMLLSRYQKADKYLDIKIANRLFENVSKFKYLGTTVTNQNLIQEEPSD
jgi:hypothetical protein